MCASIVRKTASRATAPASRPSVSPEVQPLSLPLITAYVPSITAAVTVTAPAMSRRRSSASPVVGEQREGEQEDGDPDRKVGEEDPVPGERVREHTAGSATPVPPGQHEAEEDPHRFCALGRVGEDRHDPATTQPTRSRRRRSPPSPRRGLLRARQPARERRDRTAQVEEQAPAPEQVAEPARRAAGSRRR